MEQRQRELADSLRYRLDADTQGQSTNVRVQWLLSHLKEYLSRWTTWVSCYSMAAFLQHDAHVVLVLTIDMIDEERWGLVGCDAFQAKWQAFAETVRRIDQGTDKDIGRDLVLKLDDACRALDAC